MTDKLPTLNQAPPTMPTVFDGKIYEQVGKYARQSVLFAFEQMGGPQALTEWAQTNKGEFFTKLFPKIIAKESEVKVTRDIDALMDLIDGDYEVVDGATVEEAVVLDPPTDFPAYEQQLDMDLDDMVEFEE